MPPPGPRILFVSGEYPPRIGGIGDHVVRLRAELETQGAKTWVATESVRAPDASSRTYPARPRPWGRLLAAVVRLVRVMKPDVVHVQYQPGAFESPAQVSLLPAALRLAGYRETLAVTFHDRGVPYLFPKAGRLRRAALDVLRRAADVVIYVDANDAGADGQVPAAARGWRHIPSGPTVEPPDDLADRAELRRELGADADAYLVGFFGFRQRSKGVDILSDAVRQPELRDRRLRLALIGAAAPGTGPRRAEPAVPSAMFDGIDRIDTGALAPREVSAWLRACDVVVLPYRDGLSTRHGTFMTTVAHGVPVITTRPASASPPEVTDREVAYVPPGDAAAITSALVRIHDQPEYRRSLAAGARAVARRYSWRRIAERTLAAYEA